MLQSQLVRLQQPAQGAEAQQIDQQMLQEVEAAQGHVEQLEEHIMAWQVSIEIPLCAGSNETPYVWPAGVCQACTNLLYAAEGQQHNLFFSTLHGWQLALVSIVEGSSNNKGAASGAAG